MNKYKIEITEPAEIDLNKIGNYIKYELLEPGIAFKTVEKIGDKILELENMPFKYELIKDERLSLKGIRKIVVNNYIIFFKISENTKIVTIIRILYAKRNWIDIL